MDIEGRGNVPVARFPSTVERKGRLKDKKVKGVSGWVVRWLGGRTRFQRVYRERGTEEWEQGKWKRGEGEE